MGRADKANLQEDEALAEAVKQFPCLYDKSSQHYKDNRKKENAWKLVDQELGLEEGKKIINNIFLTFFHTSYFYRKIYLKYIKCGRKLAAFENLVYSQTYS